MRAGLFGGTFNPVHMGHLKVADQVLNRFALERLYLIPCRVPPHKAPAYLAPAADRMRMLELALPADRRYHLSDVEIQRRGLSFTIDTVTHFSQQLAPGADIHLVMGLDAFLDLHTWKSWRRLLAMVQPVVVTRRMANEAPSATVLERMDGYIRSRLSEDYRLVEHQSCWQRQNSGAIHLIEATPVDISSSNIRQLIRTGKSAAGLVPDAVWAYIEQKELYR